MSRPTMRSVPAKPIDQQAALMLMTIRDRLVRNRTRLSNAIRGHAAEFGLTVAKGMAHIKRLFERVAEDEAIPALARDLFTLLNDEFARLQIELEAVETKLLAWHRADECSRRLAQIPGVGPIGASLLTLKTPAPSLFHSGRDFAAWMGLTPRDHSTGGKLRLGRITRAGDEILRATLVQGATAILRHIRCGNSKYANTWVLDMLNRKPPKLVAIALANKIARIAWKMMVTGENYKGNAADPSIGSAA